MVSSDNATETDFEKLSNLQHEVGNSIQKWNEYVENSKTEMMTEHLEKKEKLNNEIQRLENDKSKQNEEIKMIQQEKSRAQADALRFERLCREHDEEIYRIQQERKRAQDDAFRYERLYDEKQRRENDIEERLRNLLTWNVFAIFGGIRDIARFF